MSEKEKYGLWKDTRTGEEEFNEFYLITGLARYYCESELIPSIVKGVLPFELYKHRMPFEDKKELEDFYRDYSDRREAFPATHISDWHEKRLDDLLEWITPILSPPPLLGDDGLNLASALFNNECLEYLEELGKAWDWILRDEVK